LKPFAGKAQGPRRRNGGNVTGASEQRRHTKMSASEAAEGKKRSFEEINRGLKGNHKAVNLKDRHLPNETKLGLSRMIHQIKMEKGKGIRDPPSLLNAGQRTRQKSSILTCTHPPRRL
jgi:hypothetical protein